MHCLSSDDVQDIIIITFELDNYGATEGQSSVEVCAIASATPNPGQAVSAQISTQDGSAIGKLSLVDH